MRCPLLSIALSSLVLAVLLAGPAAAASTTPARARKAAGKQSHPRSTPGLETIIQDDGLLLFRPAAEVRAAVARMKALGVDRVRITAGWSSLTRAPDAA